MPSAGPELHCWVNLYRAWLTPSAPPAQGEARDAVASACSEQALSYATYVLGLALSQQYQYEEAQEPLQRAIALAEKIDDGRLAGLAHLATGRRHHAINLLKEAAKSYAQANASFSGCSDRRSEALCLRSQGILAYEMGDIHSELALYQKSVGMLTALEDRANVARVIGHIGIWYSERGNHEEATEHFTSALTEFVAMNSSDGQFWMRYELATTDLFLGNYSQAESIFRHYETEPDLLSDSMQETDILDGLAMVMRATGRYSLAHRYQERSFVERSKLGNTRNILYSYLELTRILNDMDSYAEALAMASRALSDFQRNNIVTGDLYHELGRSYLGLRKPDDAFDNFERARAMHILLDAPIAAAEDMAGLLCSNMSHNDCPDPQLVNTLLASIKEQPALHGAARPFWSYCVLLKFLNEQNDPRTAAFAHLCRTEFEEQLNKLSDPTTKRSFLQNVPWNQQLSQYLSWPVEHHPAGNYSQDHLEPDTFERNIGNERISILSR